MPIHPGEVLLEEFLKPTNLVEDKMGHQLDKEVAVMAVTCVEK